MEWFTMPKIRNMPNNQDDMNNGQVSLQNRIQFASQALENLNEKLTMK